MYNFKTALQSKIDTREALARLEKEEMPRMMRIIDAACQEGEFFVYATILFDSTIDTLKELGYKVKDNSDFTINYYEISWED